MTNRYALTFACCAVFTVIQAQDVLVYSNQFITPLQEPTIATWCQLDFGVDPVNDLWAGTGLGTSSGAFVNTNTVETILVTGPADVYDDPSNIGGDYSIGMLNTNWGDKLGLLIDTEGLPFVNVRMDISAINTTCGGPLPMDTVEFLLELLDAPGGSFTLSTGTVLDTDTLKGTGPNADSFVFNWANVSGSLDVSGSTDGMVALRMTLIRCSYASFDNIYIEASEDEVITSVAEASAPAIAAYPVPCTDALTVTGLGTGTHRATICSALGHVVGNALISSQGVVDVAALAPGAYLLRVDEGAGQQTVRFVKL